ncbi:NAD(P)-dependent malic enzyme [Cytobacillus firmus]|uniref:NAD(P)-dependent malic enzyme n=1 Tax=Cytobacillus firmus TaxID=1399 RepID=UPI00077C37C4|nr:malic enzyme-like NAD(P)-binding protein [Cytobacillus firmus]MBG9542441.1 malate dehydrogenase [Cytobacillus firmus]MBG9552009.1 malate dehydrogenase [Cytobacillus firmus]MBG9558360.1 malate dehydrogenase [Cytobacillus firmus]MBG9573457.1 malate dehydrogenase [Cytobacillus firmus]MBG9655533.1 malate dehydrogenase [Cytobacillus firmus]
MDLQKESLLLHEKFQGKLTVDVKMPLNSMKDLSIAYSPGVAEPCQRIHDQPEKVYDYTIKGNLIAVVSDGTSVLGLGDIGPEASMPVMEGKAALFKAFAGVDAVPICLDTKDPEEIIKTVRLLQPSFGGINLEDIAAPNCFYIEERLKQEMNIPVFHDDQHGTAIVTAAGLINALKLAGKKMDEIKIVINGAGAAGIAIIKLFLNMGAKDIIMCDTKGAIYEGRQERMNPVKESVAKITNPGKRKGPLEDVIIGADVFIGVSSAGALTKEMVETMSPDSIIFAMANPIPEIMPDEAKAAGAKVVGTGRSDLPNQVNNVLAFPGIFRGALDVRATEINEEMKMAAVEAIAGLIDATDLTPDYVIPGPLDSRVVPAVRDAVVKAAQETGAARIEIIPNQIINQ